MGAPRAADGEPGRRPILGAALLEVFVPGVLVPQPHLGAAAGPNGIQIYQASGGARIHTFKATLKMFCHQAMAGRAPFTGALQLRLEFRMPRPKKLLTPKMAGVPQLFARRPDAENLLEGVQDALNLVVWTDDALITTVKMRKRYCLGDEQPGVELAVWQDRMEDWP